MFGLGTTEETTIAGSNKKNDDRWNGRSNHDISMATMIACEIDMVQFNEDISQPPELNNLTFKTYVLYYI